MAEFTHANCGLSQLQLFTLHAYLPMMHQSTLPTDRPLDEWLADLRAGGYRLTEARRVLIELMATSCRPLSAHQLYALAQKTQANVGLATVYRTLEKLEELGLVQRVHDQQGCHSYIANTGFPNPLLLLCEECGRLAPVDDARLTRLIQSIIERSDYQIQHYWLQLNGLCPDCQSE